MACHTRRIGAGIFMLAALSAPASSSAADLATVTVRVEGDADTLLAAGPVAAAGAAVVRSGNSCPGDSAAAALERATAGAWSGNWNAGFSDWELTTIKGETHSFAAAAYWGFFVNDTPAAAGICGQRVQSGDRVLFAPAPSNFDPVGVLALDGVPAIAEPGQPFTVTVRRTATGYGGPPDYAAITETLPLAGATITLPGGASATTAADGTAAITLGAGGPAVLRAVHGGDVRSPSRTVCATSGADGLCGTSAPAAAGPAPSALAPARAADRTPALPRVAGLREGARYRLASAPRTLSGSVAADESGVRDVLLRLTRSVPRRGGRLTRCVTYDATRERWVRAKRCGTEGGRWFSVGGSTAWSYLLPAALKAGRYVLDVRTVDGAGNVTRGADRSPDPAKPRTRVVFKVG